MNKTKYKLQDLESSARLDSKHNSVKDAKNRAKMSFGTPITSWVYDKKSKKWIGEYGTLRIIKCK